MNHHSKWGLVTTQPQGTGKETCFFRVYSRGSCPRLGHVGEYFSEKMTCAHCRCELNLSLRWRCSKVGANSVSAGPLVGRSGRSRGPGRSSAELEWCQTSLQGWWGAALWGQTAVWCPGLPQNNGKPCPEGQRCHNEVGCFTNLSGLRIGERI